MGAAGARWSGRRPSGRWRSAPGWARAAPLHGRGVRADPDRARRLDAAAVGAPGRPRTGRARVVRAAAEQLPVADASIDSVVCNLVLCTALDPAGALREIARVLRPGGQLLFVEHVRPTRAGWARWQERTRAAGARSRAAVSSRARHSRHSRPARWRSSRSSAARLRTVPLVHSIIWGRAIRPA